jgi:hypothetical protein
MSDSNDVEIGRSNFSGKNQNYTSQKWFYLKDNVDNIYRVLPPIKGLARTGEYMKFYAIHRNIPDTKARKRAFQCVEQKNRDGIITQHCALCDRVRELEVQLKLAKDGGASKDQLQDFRMTHIMPLQVEKKFYINVVNQEGAIGILSVPYKLGKSLELLGKQWEGRGFDITGMNGVFLNFKKVNRFKGDKEVQYSVDAYMAPTADGQFNLLKHELTPEVVQRLGSEAGNLANLFKTIEVDQVSMLSTLEGEARAEYMTSLWATPEKEEEASALVNRIPGTNAVAVSHVNQKASGLEILSPAIPKDFGANTPKVTAPVNPPEMFKTHQVTDFQGMIPTGGQQVAQATQKGLTDEEFFNLVKPRR